MRRANASDPGSPAESKADNLSRGLSNELPPRAFMNSETSPTKYAWLVVGLLWPVAGLTIYAGGAMRDAPVNVSVIFICAAVSLVVCAGLLTRIKLQTKSG
jgi:hypothetical protein